MGDIHFSQGDGEITFCGAIEMAGYLNLQLKIIKGGIAKYGIINPVFKSSPLEPTYSSYLIFEGISVDEAGKQYLDVHIAYRRACLNAIEYLKKFGYTSAQAYAILGTAPVQGHISGVVDIPNACATLWLPTDIFAFEVMPNASSPVKHVTGGVDIPMSPDESGGIDAGLRISVRRVRPVHRHAADGRVRAPLGLSGVRRTWHPGSY